ncbi:hypothetical protein ABZ011_32045, partial [Streptomyces sp. NPDC006320]
MCRRARTREQGPELSAAGSCGRVYEPRARHGGERRVGPERWTLDGPEPYAVPLPLHQPEEPDAQVVPLA